jgi:hypothetical protein
MSSQNVGDKAKIYARLNKFLPTSIDISCQTATAIKCSCEELREIELCWIAPFNAGMNRKGLSGLARAQLQPALRPFRPNRNTRDPNA